MKKLLFAAAAAFGLSSAAQASVIPVLDTVTPVGSDYEFSYTATLAGDQGFKAGSTFVIYDFAGYVAGSISSGIYAPNLLAFTELTSAQPPPFGEDDDPLVENLVFRWKGSPFRTTGGPFLDIDFSGLTAKSIYAGVRLDGYSSLTITNNGKARGKVAYSAGLVGVPNPVPEPAAWSLLILGFGGIGATLRRRRSAFA